MLRRCAKSSSLGCAGGCRLTGPASVSSESVPPRTISGATRSPPAQAAREARVRERMSSGPTGYAPPGAGGGGLVGGWVPEPVRVQARMHAWPAGEAIVAAGRQYLRADRPGRSRSRRLSG